MLNFDIKTAQEKRELDLHELEEIILDAYESSKIYKERTKAFHDKNIIRKDLKEGDRVLLFNSRLKLFPGKLKSRWSGPFTVKEVSPFGAVTLFNKEEAPFTVNGQRVKLYLRDYAIPEGTSIPLAEPPSLMNEGSHRTGIEQGSWKEHKTSSIESLDDEVEPCQGKNRRNSDESSRRRAEITRGKRHVESEDDFELDEEMEDIESPRNLRDERPVHPLTTNEMALIRIFRKMKFEGTRYPEPRSDRKLRITDDVNAMFDN
ncbi:unnamed protein product [Microthlaspi erraticum]|uniref:Arabidopsis retrotransposon Orf1 C-terminal domain-containing protein n=1 Tax=Microthlaspi erraticum TaxID=1685480 RepID=A0A6D2JM67_9BRAS|nr:unnamed protein product [Microthlaspi erraticum]